MCQTLSLIVSSSIYNPFSLHSALCVYFPFQSSGILLYEVSRVCVRTASPLAGSVCRGIQLKLGTLLDHFGMRNLSNDQSDTRTRSTNMQWTYWFSWLSCRITQQVYLSPPQRELQSMLQDFPTSPVGIIGCKTCLKAGYWIICSPSFKTKHGLREKTWGISPLELFLLPLRC